MAKPQVRLNHYGKNSSADEGIASKIWNISILVEKLLFYWGFAERENLNVNEHISHSTYNIESLY